MTYEEGILREQKIYQEEIVKFDRLAELAIKLDLPMICPKWNIKVLRPDGDIRIERDSFNHSWTRNGFNAHTQLSALGSLGGTITYADGGIATKRTSDGALTTITNNRALESVGGGYNATDGDVTTGLIIGTGTTAEALNDFVIETIIPEGTAGGEMEYGFTTKILDAWNAGASRWESQWERFYDNLSGGSITVNEFAAYEVSEGDNILCMIRDIINPGQPVANTERLVINQEFRVLIP